jgi:hypothetical protein
VQDDALALLLDVGDVNDTGWLQRGRAPELGPAMRARRFDQPLIEKECFKNWLCVLGRTWRAERQRRYGGRHCLGEASLRSSSHDLAG